MQLNLFPIKQCTKCKRILLITEFYKRNRGINERYSRCKNCDHKKNRKWQQENKEKLKGYTQEYRRKNKEKINKRQRKYRQENPEKTREYRLRYKEYKQKWRQENKEKEREYTRRHRRTLKGKLANIISCRKYNQSVKGRRKRIKRQHNLGFNPLNESFEGSVWHHINNNDVVAIPEKIHLKFTGYPKHRELILEYYGSTENMLKTTGESR